MSYEALSRPFDQRFIQTVKKGNRSEDYVNHAVVTNRLNLVLGVEGWSFRVGDVFTYVDQNGAPHVGHVLGEIAVGDVVRQDIGVPTRISKYDDEIKTAASDALKRAAMRFGVAIQLWHEIENSGEAESTEGVRHGEGPTSSREASPEHSVPSGLEEHQAGQGAEGGRGELPSAPTNANWQELWDLCEGDLKAARRAVTRANKMTKPVTEESEQAVTQEQVDTAVAMMKGGPWG